MFSIQEAGLLYISKAQGRALMGIVKISHQESSVKGVRVCGVYHNCAFLKMAFSRRAGMTCDISV